MRVKVKVPYNMLLEGERTSRSLCQHISNGRLSIPILRHFATGKNARRMGKLVASLYIGYAIRDQYRSAIAETNYE
jgi:hypothetical protein